MNNNSANSEDEQTKKCQSLSEKSSFCYKQKYLGRLFWTTICKIRLVRFSYNSLFQTDKTTEIK